MKKKINVEELIGKLSKEIEELKKRIPETPFESSREAQQASKKTSEYRNRALEAKDEAQKHLESSRVAISKIEKIERDANSYFANVEQFTMESESFHARIFEIKNRVDEVEELFNNSDELSEKIKNLKSIYDSGEQSLNKINALYNGIVKRKNEFDEIYYEVMGYDEESDENGNSERVEGLKDELEAAYSKLSSDIKSSRTKIEELVSDAKSKLNDAFTSQKDSFDDTVIEWRDEYLELAEKIKKLLPDALTAGLSSAYYDKRTAEIDERDRLNSTFKWAIAGLLLVSLIPFSLNAYLFSEGKTLEEILLDLPNTVLAILPVYIPLLWVAYSSNKKANLSKRLIEEYTHKEVLSKTFEGLSNQIESIENDSISTELRIKLLHNILDVSSENPGKLISDYNKSDHPVIDALEKSSKLGDAIEKVAKIPGIGKLTEVLEVRAKSALENEREKIDRSIETISGLEGRDRSNQSKSKLETEKREGEPA
ncbi:hypothetical protein [Microbulbifer sp. SAOS-129_SWC]|uniref:hypothetical protein n=1 Tax=Microbulbifer sp. SAOS-129_SWC TaxID=3145235 RepID=UPI0032172209